jgi:hypothetical protein
MARFEIPDGWTQAFQFALDCTPEQERCIRRQFGGRRYARNWAVRTLREDISRADGQLGPRSSVEPTARPGLAGQVALKRGREPANRLGTDPETGYSPVTDYDSLTSNGTTRCYECGDSAGRGAIPDVE